MSELWAHMRAFDYRWAKWKLCQRLLDGAFWVLIVGSLGSAVPAAACLISWWWMVGLNMGATALMFGKMGLSRHMERELATYTKIGYEILKREQGDVQ